MLSPQRGEVGELGRVLAEEAEHLGQLRVEGADLLDGCLPEACRQAAGAAEGPGDLRWGEDVPGDLDGPAEELAGPAERDCRAGPP